MLRPDRCTIIAEAGVNHDGSLGEAMRLVDAAAEAGADAVKFQTFRADDLVSRDAPKADYQRRTTDPAQSQWEMIRRLELDAAVHHRLIDHCDQVGIAFLSSPFDVASLEFLAGLDGVGAMKIPSGEITNGPLLLQAGACGLPIILSTGMSTLGEVEMALGVLAFGLLGGVGEPSLDAFATAYASEQGGALLAEQVILLQCATEYPAPFGEVNLRGMDALGTAFGLRVGLSDHTPGIAIALGAAARGAALIEKHLTTDRGRPGPDHAASMEPAEFKALVEGVRAIEEALGDGRKIPRPSELKNRPVARKSLVAARDIAAGESYSKDNLAIKRPGEGRSPMDYWALLGRPAPRALTAGEAIL